MTFQHLVIPFIFFFFLVGNAIADETQNAGNVNQDSEQLVEQMERLQKLQIDSIEQMNKALPKSSAFFNSIIGGIQKLEEMENERRDRIEEKNAVLEEQVRDVLELLDAGKTSHAKLKALLIRWSPIGITDIDSERTEHFEKIKDELLLIISEN